MGITSRGREMTYSKMLAAVAAAIGIAGCTTRSPAIEDLSSATKLTLSPGTLFERVLQGEELKEYLSTFAADTEEGFRMVHNTQNGTIVIANKTYPLTYSEEKMASCPAIMSINVGGRTIKIRQTETINSAEESDD